MRYILLTLCISLSCLAHAQTTPPSKKAIPDPEQVPVGKVYDAPELKAHFLFGQDSLDRFIRKSMRFRHVDNGGSGKAIVVFIVEPDGSIGNAEIMSTSGDKDFDKEAVRVAKTMPKWIPAKNKGKVVRSSAMLSVSYSLRG